MFDCDRFIEDCRSAFTSDPTGQAVKGVVERAVAAPSALERVFGPPTEGGVATLHHSPELTILHLVWTPGMAIYPHDHRMWAVIGLYGGREDNLFYRRSQTGLEPAGGRQLDARDTVLLGQHVIHAVSNPLGVFTAAIHVYGGDFFNTPRSDWTPDTFEERPYDVARAKQVFADANERWRAECEAVRSA